MYRDRLWLSLLLTLPILVWSEDILARLGYNAPTFPGSEQIAPIRATIVFGYGGIVFIGGAAGELRDRRPGMMTLISLAIVVVLLTSWARTPGLFDVEIWWSSRR